MKKYNFFKNKNIKSEIKSNVTNQQLIDLINSCDSSSINSNNAKQLSCVYSCCNVLAESLASFPLKVYERNSDGSKKNIDLYKNLIEFPNDIDTYFDFIERIMWQLTLRGKCFYYKVKGLYKTEKLLPIENPDSVEVKINDKWEYEFKVNGKKYNKDGILYFKSHNGNSVIKDQNATFMHSKYLKDYSANYFKNSAKPGGIIEMPGSFKDDEAFDRFAAQWKETYGNPKNAGKVAILEGGKTFHPIDISNEDAQFLDTKKYTDSQICGLFRVPPHMVGNLENATFSNIENLALQFTTFTMLPWCKRIESVFNSILRETNENYYCEFLMDNMQRGNIAQRFASYNLGRNMGVYSPNDIRKMENKNPISEKDGGNKYLVPLNMGIAGEDRNEK